MRKHNGNTVRLCVFLVLTLLITAFGPDTCFSEADITGRNAGGVKRSLAVDLTGRTGGFSAVLYDNRNGLPTSEANAIAETSEGFIWIGSYAGLIRYDGNTFERIGIKEGISSIKCLYVDSRDRLWMGTNDNGIAVMENGEFRQWGKLDGLRSAHTRAITEDRNGTIYLATTCGIATIDKDYKLAMLEDDQIAEANMRFMITGPDGLIYGLTNLGDIMTLQDGRLLNYIPADENTVTGAVGAFYPDMDEPGMVYIQTLDYPFCHARMGDTLTDIVEIDIRPLSTVQMISYIDGKLWICASNGIGYVENDEFHLLENLPMNNSVGGVMMDYLGNLWFTSTRQGVMKIVPNPFSDLFQRFDLPANVVNTTCMIGDKLLIGSDTGLTALDENGLVPSLPLTEAVTASGEDLGADDLIELLNGCRIRSIIRDSRDRVWISIWRKLGLLCYDHGKVKVFTNEDGLLTGSLRAVAEKEDGKILVALAGGVNIIEGDRVVGSYGEKEGISNTESLTVTEGLNGEIILGSNGGGIYIIDESGVKNINVEDGLPSDVVMRVKRDTAHNVIWLVCSSAIAYMTPDHRITTIKKFPYTNNFDLYENNHGDMWVLSSNGIYVTPTEELLANGEIDPVYYSLANGLPCITTANSYSELTADGDLYIPGSTGVCKVNIDQPFENVNDLNAVVPFVEADGKTIYPDESGAFTVPSDTQKLTVSSFVFNYSLSDPQVSYQLEGFERQSTTVNRSDMVPVDYTNLGGGTYHYVMQLKDSMGRGNKVVSVRIVKEKAFYEQTWFYIVAGLLALALLAAVMQLYIRRRMRAFERKQQEAHEQFEQTAEALASAIDAKDRYTNGHSRRVAEYSLKIAKEAGKSEEECEKIYFAALLHDVGKIGVPIEILSKKGRLTDEEFQQIKQHPVVGGQILSSIRKSPWLSIGARYHHERYNGRGYPEGLKGEEIPETARIIAVADSYDAMTSNRSYRNAIPQQIVREELVKGLGTQFDPEFAKIMIHLIDLDTEYRMQESQPGQNQTPATSLRCDSIYHDCTDGFAITKKPTVISLCSMPDEGLPGEESLPSLIVFDSLDGKVHPGEENNKNLLYYEYAQIRLDGRVVEGGIRNVEVSVCDQETTVEASGFGEPEREQRYKVEAVRYRDHMRVRVSDEKQTIQIILALPDLSRFAYISIGGEHCYVHNILVDSSGDEVGPDAIPRIAEEISFIKGCPEGDVPNIQIDGWRTEATDGIPIRDGMTLTFHTMSLPTARLVWHCPFISVFSSGNGRVNGENFREYMLLRLDGENWESDEHVENKVQVEQRADFEGWNVWKEKNRQGLDCTVTIRKEKNSIVMQTETLGIAINSVTTIRDDVKNVYVALTGDQCVITNIHVSRGE